jgi:hypothetical protein
MNFLGPSKPFPIQKKDRHPWYGATWRPKPVTWPKRGIWNYKHHLHRKEQNPSDGDEEPPCQSTNPALAFNATKHTIKKGEGSQGDLDDPQV